MRKALLRTLLAGAGAIGAVAANNARLQASAGHAPSTLAGTPRPWRWRSYDMFAMEAGSGPLVVLVHGIYAGSSSFEYRKLFALLSRRYRTVAIDLLGCGRSARPNIDYDAEMFVDQIAAALDHFGPATAALIGSSLGGAFCVRAAARLGERIGALTLICPTGLDGTLDRAPGPLLQTITRLVRTPLIGEALFNGLASRPSLGWFLRNQAYADPRSATADIVQEYWETTHQPGARFVPAHFVGGALNCPIAGDLPRVSAPVLVAWGERADRPSPLSSAPLYVKLARRGELATFADSRLLPHEEEPQAVCDRVARFIERSMP